MGVTWRKVARLLVVLIWNVTSAMENLDCVPCWQSAPPVARCGPLLGAGGRANHFFLANSIMGVVLSDWDSKGESGRDVWLELYRLSLLLLGFGECSWRNRSSFAYPLREILKYFKWLLLKITVTSYDCFLGTESMASLTLPFLKVLSTFSFNKGVP